MANAEFIGLCSVAKRNHTKSAEIQDYLIFYSFLHSGQAVNIKTPLPHFSTIPLLVAVIQIQFALHSGQRTVAINKTMPMKTSNNPTEIIEKNLLKSKNHSTRSIKDPPAIIIQNPIWTFHH